MGMCPEEHPAGLRCHGDVDSEAEVGSSIWFRQPLCTQGTLPSPHPAASIIPVTFPETRGVGDALWQLVKFLHNPIQSLY